MFSAQFAAAPPLLSLWRMMLALAVPRLPWQPVAIAMDLSSLADGRDDEGGGGVGAK